VTICLLPPATGSATLTATGLAAFPLVCEQGWSLEQLQIGFPGARPVVRSRALADGVFDESRYLGSRAVTLTLRIATPTATQAALDALMPFLSPRRRPILTYALAGDPTALRSLELRGIDAPVVIDGPSYQRIVCSWVSTDSFVQGANQHCVLFEAGAVTGRTYNLVFNRVYSSTGSTSTGTITNVGNAPAHWTAVLTSTTTDPTVRINGVDMTFDQNGGVSLVGSQTLNIDTRNRTILLNNDPLTPAYNRTNFFDWTWDDLLLQPGNNVVQYILDPGDDSSLTLCYYDYWL
jgi:hypothetical protein